MNRRASIIAPLVLIAVGGLFLLHNLNPELSIARLVAAYWPWVLIGWGAIRLVEIVFWHSRGQSLPVAGISGGEWTFVVFLSLLGGGIATAHRVNTNWPVGRFTGWGWEIMGEHYDFPVTADADAAKVTRVIVENLRGTVRINGTDEVRVKVTGRKSIRAFDRATADKADRETPIEIQRQGDVLYIRTNQDRWSGSERISGDLEVSLPKGVELECKGRVGDFDVTGLRNAVTINSDNAGVRLNDITGKVDINVRRSDIVRAVNIQGDVTLKGGGEDLEFDTISGQVTVDFRYSGDLEFKNLAKALRFESNTVNLAMERITGRLQLTRSEIDADGVVGPSRIKSSSKDIRLTGFSGPAQIELERGDITLQPGKGPLGTIDARTNSGEIEVALPEKAGFQLNASVGKGSVENDYGQPISENDTGRGARLSGSTGPGPAITLEANRGKIRVTKSAAVVAQVENL